MCLNSARAAENNSFEKVWKEPPPLPGDDADLGRAAHLRPRLQGGVRRRCLDVALRDRRAGRRVARTYPACVWLNPVPLKEWDFTHSIKMVQQLMSGRMYPLTLDGLDHAMRELVR
jgi:hypothetical protein